MLSLPVSLVSIFSKNILGGGLAFFHYPVWIVPWVTPTMFVNKKANFTGYLLLCKRLRFAQYLATCRMGNGTKMVQKELKSLQVHVDSLTMWKQNWMGRFASCHVSWLAKVLLTGFVVESTSKLKLVYFEPTLWKLRSSLVLKNCHSLTKQVELDHVVFSTAVVCFWSCPQNKVQRSSGGQ